MPYEATTLKTKIDNLVLDIQHDLAQPYRAFDVSREPYIAEMWAYAKSMAHHAQRVEGNLLSIENKLRLAQNCSEDWLKAWARMAALSLGQTRDLHAAVVSELKQLAHVYRTLRSEF